MSIKGLTSESINVLFKIFSTIIKQWVQHNSADLNFVLQTYFLLLDKGCDISKI